MSRPIIDVEDQFIVILRDIRNHLATIPPERATIFRSGKTYVTADGEPMAIERVKEELSCWFNFQKFNKNGSKSAYPPHDVVKSFAQHVDERLPELRGSWKGPLIRPNGDIVTKRGYDAESQLWLEGWEGPDIVATTKAEAIEAAEELYDLVSPGPFEDDSDFAAWLAHMITIACRPIIKGQVPTFAYTSSATGSGKTTLARIAGLLGGSCSAYTVYSPKDEEMGRKLADHHLKAAVVVDNVRGKFENQAIEAAVTGGDLPLRLLHRNPMNVPMRCVIAVTANGAEFGMDMIRRVIPCCVAPVKLDAGRDVMGEIDEVLVAILYSILRVWLRSGAESKATPLKSFKEWSEIVAGCIHWLGISDIAVDAERKADRLTSSEDDAIALLDTIEQIFGSEVFTAADLFKARGDHESLQDLASIRQLSTRLRRLHDSSRAVKALSRTKSGRRFRIVPR